MEVQSNDEGKVSGSGNNPPPDLASEIASLKAEIASMKSAKPKPEPIEQEDEDLLGAARRKRKEQAMDEGQTKKLESAITFNMKLPDFIKTNSSLLPKEVEDIVAAADKETYNNQVEKGDSIKACLVQSFFGVQANVELLTPWQKEELDEYLKLTKTGKQEKAQQIYDMIFEPAFDKLKSIKKAAALSKGLHTSTSVDEEYKKRLIASSEKHHFRGKKA